jgi:hypothetical protein
MRQAFAREDFALAQVEGLKPAADRAVLAAALVRKRRATPYGLAMY